MSGFTLLVDSIHEDPETLDQEHAYPYFFVTELGSVYKRLPLPMGRTNIVDLFPANVWGLVSLAVVMAAGTLEWREAFTYQCLGAKV